MKKNSLYLVIIVSLLTGHSTYSQSRDNLSQIYLLSDSSVADVVNTNKLEGQNYFVKLIAPDNYTLIKNRVLFSFTKKGISNKSGITKIPINYSVDKVGVKYIDIFRDGWFGDYLLERQIFLKGSVIVFKKNNPISREFYYSKIDTVEYSNIQQLENPNLPFTKNNVPSEPFFSSLFEPIIVVGTIVVTVLLLFNVRSK